MEFSLKTYTSLPNENIEFNSIITTPKFNSPRLVKQIQKSINFGYVNLRDILGLIHDK